MFDLAIIVLRIGLGITFVLMGVNILRSLDTWEKSVEQSMPSFVKALLPISLRNSMKWTGVYDVANGVWLLLGFLPFWAAFFAALHMVTVLISTKPSPNWYRDITVLFASISLALLTWPF